MGDADIKTSSWRLVERGRVVLFTTGPHEGKLATIAEIIDHKRVLVDGPASTPEKTVPRHSAPLANVTLTHIVVPKIPLAAGTGAVKKQWEAAEVEKNWDDSVWAKTRARSGRRRELSDFERFKAMRLRKLQRFEVRKNLAKIRASAKA